MTSLNTAPPETRTDQHPLAPLSAAEIRTAATVLRAEQNLDPGARFISIALREPPKAVVQALPAGPTPPREAFVVIRDPRRHATYEAVVDLDDEQVTTWRHVPGVQPSLTPEEFRDCEAAVKADPRWQAAMARRGVTDLGLAITDAWTVGHTPELGDPDRRLVRPLTFVRTGPEDNPYARPVEGLTALVDLDEMRVLDVTDVGETPLPPRAGNYRPDSTADPDNWPRVTAPRHDLRPVTITQPDGPSFTVQGHCVHWQKWKFRLGFTPREGLVLYELGYLDKGRVRPIIYRASLSEMFTPYADPSLVQRTKNAFDEGEYGAGFMVNTLEPGCDCLGEIHYFDAVVNNQNGDPVPLTNAICMHEEDYGVGWKHTDFRTGSVETRRLRRLVISSFAVLGNYQYGYFWYLYTDGTIQFEIKLTGMISTGAIGPGETPRYGTMVAPGLYGPNHQHFFNVRLDMCVDGNANSVHEVNAEAVPTGEDNPYGNAWVARRTLLRRESRAQRVIEPLTGRHWLISNPNVRNGLGEPVAYKLMPGANVLPLQQPSSQAGRRAGFAFKHFWVTAYDPAELYAAGDYPNQRPGHDGLPRYTEADRQLENSDIVAWYTFGDHHVVRPEDWPVMPVTCVGFQLKPAGFFDGNPALDMPPTQGHCGIG
ncbi:primary-amine oxidase [Nocardia transvalensis]|uniref:primary-amine oxidase n=1 Tax=Nocardia transvalensis TaxID=37333 RepID=UPI001893A281|nr:primary-amine oxidase [Nocardia transvalensis]MBF6330372.1 primary-amine oxidase [Nocardia transvalensis]